jgi:hypothetical protein
VLLLFERVLIVFSVGAGSSVLVGFLTWILCSVVVGWAVVLLWEVAIAESLQWRRRVLPETRTRNLLHVYVEGLAFGLVGFRF